MFWKRCLLQAERSKESQREQNWTKVSSLMLHQQLSNQRVAPVLNELHGPTVHIPHTSSARLRVPLPGSLRAPSPLSPENGRWESIPHHKSNHIILSFSITTLSLPPSLHPPHSITLPSSSPCLLLPRSPCPSQNRIYSVVKAGWGLSPTLICNSRSLPAQFSEKELELNILGIHHLCTLSWLTKRVLQPQVTCAVQLWPDANAS